MIHPHIERHSTAREFVRDAVIGLADGLTVPFALAAGLAGAIDSTLVIVTAGLAEIAAGSIAMGLGGYLAVRGDAEHYAAEWEREAHEVAEVPAEEEWEVEEILGAYGVGPEEARPVISALRRNPRAWTDFMMRFELGLEAPEPRRALQSAVTIGLSYVAGGLLPLLPYMVVPVARTALFVSVAITLVALFVFGAMKSRLTGVTPLAGALKTLIIGATASAAAYLIARLIA